MSAPAELLVRANVNLPGPRAGEFAVVDLPANEYVAGCLAAGYIDP